MLKFPLIALVASLGVAVSASAGPSLNFDQVQKKIYQGCILNGPEKLNMAHRLWPLNTRNSMVDASKALKKEEASPVISVYSDYVEKIAELLRGDQSGWYKPYTVKRNHIHYNCKSLDDPLCKKIGFADLFAGSFKPSSSKHKEHRRFVEMWEKFKTSPDKSKKEDVVYKGTFVNGHMTIAIKRLVTSVLQALGSVTIPKGEEALAGKITSHLQKIESLPTKGHDPGVFGTYQIAFCDAFYSEELK